MIVFAALIIGIIIGATTARRRNGSRLDMAQYAAGYGIAFMLLSFLATVLVQRFAL